MMAEVESRVRTARRVLGVALVVLIVVHIAPRLPERAEVAWSRGFVLVLAVATYAVVLWRPASIFGIATFSFSGYVMLVPTMYGALHWRRMTAAGAIASIVVGNGVLLWTMGRSAPLWGLLPVAWGLLAAIVALVVGSWLTRPPARAVVDRALGPG